MDAFTTFLILFWVSTFQSSIKVLVANCPATNCSDGGPDIRYPFQIKGQHPPCPYHTSSDFELLCKNNTTIIHFPSYGNLVVRSIADDLKKIDLLDPNNCAHQVFLNLNLSLTPFHYFHFLKNYTYLNCSTSLSPTLMEVPCLSGPNYHLYTVDPSLPVTSSCKTVKTAAIPYEYSPYLSDNTLGLGLTWHLPESEDTKTRNQTRDWHTARNTVLIMGLCIFGIATLISIKVHWSASARNSSQQEGCLLQRLADL